MITAINRLFRIEKAVKTVLSSGSSLPLVNRFKEIAQKRTVMEIHQAASWYEDEREKILSSIIRTPASAFTAIAAFAALSPAVSPEDNLHAMRQIIYHVFRNEEIGSVRAYKKNVEKAKMILQTGDISLLKGQKVCDFYHSILHKGDSDRAPIDRWSAREFAKYRKVKGVWPDVDLNKSEYIKMQNEFKKAADLLGLYPAEFQAILWVQRRKDDRA